MVRRCASLTGHLRAVEVEAACWSVLIQRRKRHDAVCSLFKRSVAGMTVEVGGGVAGICRIHFHAGGRKFLGKCHGYGVESRFELL